MTPENKIKCHGKIIHGIFFGSIFQIILEGENIWIRLKYC